MTNEQIQAELAAIDAAIESELVHKYQASPRRVAMELYRRVENIKNLSPVVHKQYDVNILRATQDCMDKMNETL